MPAHKNNKNSKTELLDDKILIIPNPILKIIIINPILIIDLK